MPSNAFLNLERRMRDIDQLLDAHKALTQFNRARRAAQSTGGGLANVAQIVQTLVSNPGRGRPTEVDALNRSAIVLLSAHLQGYIEEVFDESARKLLSGHVHNIDAFIETALSGFSNPQPFRIDKLFAFIGFSNIMSELSWRRTSNSSVKRRLREYIKIRNAVAHGRQGRVTKRKVEAFRRFVQIFARTLDQVLENKIGQVLGEPPWP